jgi:baculoviral IAP repeat-containing protein 6
MCVSLSPNQVILQHFYLRKESILSQCEVWKAGLEDALKKTRQGDSAAHLLRNHIISLRKSTDTLKVELDKIRVQDFQPPAPPGDSDQH